MTDDREKRQALDALEARIRAAQGPRVGGPKASDGDNGADGGPGRGAGIGLGMRIGVEMVATLAVGGGIGYMLDRWLETAPLFMVVFLFLGGAAGVSNVYRVVKGLDEGVGLGRAIEEKKRRDAAEDHQRRDAARDRNGSDGA